MNFNNFYKALQFGSIGEKAFSDWVSEYGYRVDDYTKDELYQQDDVDFVVYDRDNICNNRLVEVKTDSRLAETLNICLETISNCSPERFKKGWFIITNAMWLAIYSPDIKAFVFVKVAELREYYNANRVYIKHRTTKQYESETYYKEGQIALIPIADVRDNCPSFKVVYESDKEFSFLFK